MSDIVLIKKSVIPDDSQLKLTLGTTYSFLKKLEGLTENYVREWKFYNKKSGWIYKVSNKKKSLFYVTPLKNNFNIGFALRESEREALLNSKLSNETREKLLSAEKYPEGFALRLNIKNKDDFNNLITIVSVIMELRK